MPKKNIKQENMNNIYDCDRIKSLADEYLHSDPELSDSDRKIIEEHLQTCAECLEFFAEEKKYLDEIKAAEYTPDIDISKAVMQTIISNSISIAADKPRKKIYVPFGLVAAAVIVLVMFAASKGGLMNIFTKTVNNANNAAYVTDGAGGGETAEQYTAVYVPGGELRAAVDNADNTAGQDTSADAAYTEAAQNAAAPAALASPLLRDAGPVIGSTDTSENIDVEVCETVTLPVGVQGNIFDGIEVRQISGSLFIIQSKDKDALLNNLIKEDISYRIQEEPGGDSEYIAVSLALAYTTEN
ncbi:MAG: zf-HC2 domain-containing protein [Oscillospiraceae bacterium]|nr:zf-HC2 domain-containing protein [Oscillospiraceae bacterium]